jgi:pimeloyl-[acyl-carrier protein] methyl ester esterase
MSLLPGWGMDARVFEPLLQALGQALPPGVVCGWSIGALQAMHSPPPGARALVLIAATPRFVAADDWPQGLAPPSFERFVAGMKTAPERTLKTFLALQTVGDARGAAVGRQLAAACEPARADTGGLEFLATTDLREKAAKLHLPVLLIHGEEDRLVSLAAGQWLAQTLPAARIVTLPQVSHAPHLSAPEVVAQALRAFFQSLQ